MILYIYRKITCRKEGYQAAFCHTPKTAGVAIESALAKNNDVKFLYHGQCKNHCNKPTISVLRNPIDRFISVFNYCRLGSKIYKDTETYNSDINKFIRLLKTKDKKTMEIFEKAEGICGQGHWKPQSNQVCSDTNFVCYNEKPEVLQSNFNKILYSKGIKPIQIKQRNKTNKYEASRDDLTKESLDWLNEYYAEDIKQWKTSCGSLNRINEQFTQELPHIYFAQAKKQRFELWKGVIDRLGNNVTIAEIGVWKGDFARYMLENCKNIRKYFLIDPWKQLSDWNMPLNKSNAEQSAIYQEVKNKLSKFSEKTVFLKGKTVDVINNIDDASLDLVYIDGDHTAKGITIDLLKSFPKMKKGGIIGGDDYVQNCFHGGSKFDSIMVKPVVKGFIESYKNSIEFEGINGNQFLIKLK